MALLKVDNVLTVVLFSHESMIVLVAISLMLGKKHQFLTFKIII